MSRICDLTASGNSKTEPAKVKLGNSGIIRLIDDGAVTIGLGLAEGIETALAVMQRAGWCPVWAASDAGGMRAFPVLPGIEALTLFVNRDDSGAGEGSARECSARWRSAGREVTLQLPPKGADWHDAFIGRAA
jgi:hypothetical protein